MEVDPDTASYTTARPWPERAKGSWNHTQGTHCAASLRKKAKGMDTRGLLGLGSIRDINGRKAFKVTFEQKPECRREGARWRPPGSQSSQCEGPDQ